MFSFKVSSSSIALILLISTIPSSASNFNSDGLSVACMMEYDHGGAPAVFGSPECPQWILSANHASQSIVNQTLNCQFATLRGRRKYQEDRVASDLDTNLSLLGKNGLEEGKIGVVAVFDGHGGKEASEMASKLLFDCFSLHVVVQSYKQMAEHREVLSFSGRNAVQLQIIKDALLKTIRDFDLKFSETIQEAVRNKFFSGSNATVVLLYNGRVLVANVGDSRAVLLSENLHTGMARDGDSTKDLVAAQLTDGHHPDRQDEKARIEAAGGSVVISGVPRVDGVLALSRSIGDVYLKRHGVIAEPEFTGWLLLTADDEYLVVASDGIFESLTMIDVCSLVSSWHFGFQGSETSEFSSSCPSSSTLAACIVDTAFSKRLDNRHSHLHPTDVVTRISLPQNSVHRSMYKI